MCYTASTVRVRNDSRALQFGLRLVNQLELAVGYVGVGEHCYFLPNFQSKIYSAFSICMTNRTVSPFILLTCT